MQRYRVSTWIIRLFGSRKDCAVSSSSSSNIVSVEISAGLGPSEIFCSNRYVQFIIYLSFFFFLNISPRQFKNGNIQITTIETKFSYKHSIKLLLHYEIIAIRLEIQDWKCEATKLNTPQLRCVEKRILYKLSRVFTVGNWIW